MRAMASSSAWLAAAAARGVPGDRRVVAAGRLLQGGKGLLVQAAPLATEQPAGDRLPGEGVPEGEHVRLLLDDHVLGHQVPQDADELVLPAAGDGGEQVERDPPA